LLATTTPAWASCCWKVFLPGVNCCGCLTNTGGTCCCFYATLNTCTGYFCGKANNCFVSNCTCCYQTYFCKNFFVQPCWCVCITSSEYDVGKLGGTIYSACGYAKPCSCGTKI
jgi:hypothetical protein